MPRLTILSLSLLLLLIALPLHAETCPVIVQNALQAAEANCQITGRNQACYGNNLLEAEAQPGSANFQFDSPGDFSDIGDLQTILLHPMNEQDDEWGIAMLKVQGNLPHATSENVTVLLFGAVQMQNAVQPLRVGDTVTVHTTEGDKLNIRTGPGTGSSVLVSVDDGTRLTLLEGPRILNNLKWWKVRLSNGAEGWAVESVDDNNQRLPTLIGPGQNAFYGPMQAFYMVSREDDAPCFEAPNSGILVQTPEGEAVVSLLVNEVDIQLSSTAFIQAVAGGNMTINLLEGTATVSAGGASRTLFTGERVQIPMLNSTTPSPVGLPGSVELIDPNDIRSLPLSLLPLPVQGSIAVSTPEVTADLPNLMISGTASSSSAGSGTATLNVTVTNNGTATSGPTDVTAIVNSTGQTFSASLPTVRPGQSFTVAILLSGPSGDQEVDIFVDSFGFVIESSEQDNSTTTEVTFFVIG